MTPSEVTAYLDALRAGGCMSAELILPGGATIRAVFAPDFPVEGQKLDADLPPPSWKGDVR
jgi:hypothetical protein